MIMNFITFFFISSTIVDYQVISHEYSPQAGLNQSYQIMKRSSMRKSQGQGRKKAASAMIETRCQPTQTCYSQLDCPGGRCLGLAIGKCNCGACITFSHCKSDQECGGLVGACIDNHYCNCDKGFKNAGFGSSFEALISICNVKECIPNTPSCYGLPCNAGICACPI